MGSSGEGLTSERLAEIRIRAGSKLPWLPGSLDVARMRVVDAWRDRQALLAEVERLRAALAVKEAREAALVAVVRAVAEANLICQNYFDDGMPFAPPHVDYLCPRQPVKASPLRAQARALLASAAEQGEA